MYEIYRCYKSFVESEKSAMSTKPVKCVILHVYRLDLVCFDFFCHDYLSNQLGYHVIYLFFETYGGILLQIASEIVSIDLAMH